jgi:hypothetical protein
VQAELALHPADLGWAPGARALCEMYSHTDAVRFEVILTQTAAVLSRATKRQFQRWQSSISNPGGVGPSVVARSHTTKEASHLLMFSE